MGNLYFADSYVECSIFGSEGFVKNVVPSIGKQVAWKTALYSRVKYKLLEKFPELCIYFNIG